MHAITFVDNTLLRELLILRRRTRSFEMCRGFQDEIEKQSLGAHSSLYCCIFVLQVIFWLSLVIHLAQVHADVDIQGSDECIYVKVTYLII